MTNKNFSDSHWDIFTDELKNIISFIETILTHEHPVLSINENYFLLAIFQERTCFAYKVIDALLSSTAFNLIHDAYYKIVTKGQISAIKPNRKIPFDKEFHSLIEESIEEMKLLNDERLSSIHILLSLINPDKEHFNVQKIMKGAGLNYNLLINKLNSLKNEDNNSENVDKTNTENNKIDKNKKNNSFDETYSFSNLKLLSGQFLSNYCHNLNKLAKNGKIDEVIGRDEEIKHITKIFNRRKNNNVVIVGERGSGKTAICESLAWLIVNDKAPFSLKDKTILKLDIPAMIAGTSYRGMFEERAKGVFSELNKNPNCILFIDDYHIYTSKQDNESNTDITPYLREAIDNYSIKVITTCTPKGYHKKFEKDKSFSNKFQRIDLKVMNDDEIKNILNTVKKTYEKYHDIKINENIIDLCILLCKKYVTDREMPDSVIDLIDEIGANVSKKYEESDNVLKLKTEKENIQKLKKRAIKENNFDYVDELLEQETLINAALKEENKKKNNNIIEITENVVYDIISQKTGIPIQILTEDKKKDLYDLNNRLKKVIIGQDEAIDKVCKTIKRKKLGLYNGRSTAIFLHGQTGCGKTFLAKKLAEELFGSEQAMVRLDMSEYSDKTSVQKLIGANPGYVGYEEGGLLTEAIKNKKHCILLLDEIEKANDEIFNIFLQVFDEGVLTDNTGQKVDFKNVIILLTSNIGAKSVSENCKTVGFSIEENNNERINSILNKELKKRFTPEFLNRLDGIIYFNSLSNDNLKQIIKLEIDKSVKRFKDIGYLIEYNENIIEHILYKIKDESDYGARPVIRAIQNEIEDPLTDIILEGVKKNSIKIEYVDNKIKILFV